MAFRKIEAGLVHADVDQFIGKTGTIFYDNSLGDFRISDGQTPGGIALSFGGGEGGTYTLPTATTTVKGGVKIDGSTIVIANQVISVGTVPYTKLSGTPTIPTDTNQLTNGAAYITSAALSGYATETYVTTRGYLTAVSWNDVSSKPTFATVATSGSYADLTNKPTLFSGSYVDLTNKPTIPTDINQLTDASGLLGGGGGGGTTYITNNVENPFTFSIAGDDSTLREIASGESIKITGAGGITVTTDAEGNLTITGSGGSVSSLVNGAYTVSLGSTGTLTVPANGIITAPINQEFQLQAKDANSVLRNEINLDPNNGTYMSVWSEQTTSFSSADWGSGSWNNESGLGAARFTDAQALQNFWTTGIGSLGLPIEASINGGARTPNVFYENNNGETYGVYLGLDAVPPGGQGTTVAITSLVFYYRLQSKINMDVTGGEILVDAQAMDIDLRTTLNLDLRASQELNLRSLGQLPVRIYTNGTTHKWEFDNTGSLTLPPDGKIYGIGAGANPRYGYMSWDGESSGDGVGWNTMRLVPDQMGLEDADTYIILDPAYIDSPDSIHIRAGGTRDNSLANLCLGGVNSQVKIGAGANPPVTVKANNNSWIFGTNGGLTFPDDTVQSTAWTGIADYNNLINKPNLASTYTFNVAADDSTMREISSEETVKFVGAGGITTASDAEGNITITGPNLSSYATETYVTSRGYITSAALTGLATENYVTSRGYITGLSYNDLTDKPNLAGTYTFNVAADDSTMREISSEETVKFVGAGGITTASDAEGKITITQGTTSSLVNGANTVSLGSTGVLTFPNGALTVTGNKIRNVNESVGLIAGSEIEVTVAKTVISNGLTDTEGLSNQHIFEVGSTRIFSAYQVINTLGDGEGGPSLTGQQLTELTSTGFQIGQRVINDPGGEGEPLTSFSGWTFGTVGQSQAITFPDETVQTTAWTGIADYNNLINKPSLAGTYTWSIAADDSTLREILTNESVKFIGSGGVTTASDAEGNITITGPSLTGLATETYVTTQGYITSSALTGLATETFVTSQGYITGLSYNDLTDKPNLAGTYSWSIAADDSTQLEISAGNLVKIVGAQGVTTTSNADGQITITGPDLSSYATQSYVTTALSNSGIIVSATAPAGQPEGKLWYNSASLELYVRYDSAWVAASASFSGDYNDLTNKPTSLSQFANDTNYVSRDEVYLMILELTG